MDTNLKQPVVHEARINEYNEKGFVVIDDIFSPADIKEMTDALDELIESAHGLTDHTDVIDLEHSHAPDMPARAPH